MVMLKEAERKFVDYLRGKRLKYTPQRRTIFHEALRAKKHFTADELLEYAKRHDQTISKATLYRTLGLLKESQVLDEQDFGAGKKAYERMHGIAHHDHIICVKCNSIMEFQNDTIEKIQELEARKRGFRIIFHSHRLFGLCRKCR